MYLLSQALVVASDVFCILSMLSKKKKGVVFFLILSTILFASHYMCLGGWTGASIALLEIVFLILMYILEAKNATKYNTLLSVVTIVATVILSVLTWAGCMSLLPMFAMIIYLTTMIFTNVIIVKSGTFVRLTLNGIYMLLLKSYFGAGFTVLILVFTIIGIFKDKKEKIINKESNLNEG